MNHKQRMFAVLEGKPVDRIPWVPRLDLWYKANRLAGTLPARYRDASLMEMTDDLGFGYHAVVPDYKDLRRDEDEADRPLSIHNLRFMPVRTVWEGVDRRITRQGDRTLVEYHTPVGTIRTAMLHDEAMRRAGITISHVERYAFSGPEDYEPLAYLFRHARAEPNYEGYAAMAAQVGDRGFAVAYLGAAASPMHMLQRDVMPMDVFFFELNDRPNRVRELADSIAGYWREMLAVAADCPAEVFLLGANYDAAIQYPPFYAEHIQPWLAEFADMLHGRGKYLLTHTDGENTGLLEHYVASKIDIADSICPRPMTRLSLGEVRRAFAGRITVMGGIPAVALLKESMNDRQFEEFLDDFFTQVGRGDHLILGISDTTPPAADFDRLLTIARRIEAFGPVNTA